MLKFALVFEGINPQNVDNQLVNKIQLYTPLNKLFIKYYETKTQFHPFDCLHHFHHIISTTDDRLY